MLEFLGPSPVPKPAKTNEILASSYEVSQDVLAISFHNDRKGVNLASSQNHGSQFWYGESWYGFAPQKIDYESQI